MAEATARRRARELWWELVKAYQLGGNVEFVSQCIAEDRDRGLDVDWDKLMDIAFEKNDRDIVRCIRDSGRGSLHTQLYYSFLLEDLEFVSRCISEDRDRGQNVDWDKLMDIAYDRNYRDMVRCIRDSGRGSVNTQLYYSCQYGDLQFVSQCIAEDRDRGQNVDWERLMEKAYKNYYRDIVRCIRDSGRGSLNTLLDYSCQYGDLGFVSQCIAENRDKGQNVDWEKLMEKAYKRNYRDIVRCIRDSGRGSLNTLLDYSCQYGDLGFVSKCIAEERDIGQNVDWERLMETLYDMDHMDIVRCIRNSGRVSVDRQLHYSFRYRELEFVSQCIAEDRDRGQNVDWERLMKTADEMNYRDIVRCIRDSGRGSLNTQLDYSCKYEDLGFVSECIAEDRDIGQDVDWERLIEKAYERNCRDIVRCIRDSGRGSLNTLLDYSCQYGDLGFVSKCIDDNRDRGQNVDWERLIEKAYERNCRDIVRCIRDSGRGSLNTLLDYSCQYGDLGFVSKCIDDNRDRGQNVDWERLMEKAYERNYRDIVRCIRDSGRGSLNTLLDYSCRLGDLEFVSQCIDDERDRGQTVDWERLMKTADERKHIDIVCCIRDSGRGSVEKQLYYSCRYGDLQFVSQCIAEDKDYLENVDWKNLMNKAYEQHKNIARVIVQGKRITVADLHDCLHEKDKVEFVIVNTPDINAELRPGLTALHALCHYHTENQDAAIFITSLLQTEGLDVNVKGYMGRTPLHIICHGKNEHIRNILQENKSCQKQESKADKSQSGGEIAGSFTSLVIGQLIDHGASVNAVDDNGQTPLHLVCLGEGGYCYTNSDKKTIQYIANVLINEGAMINQRDYEWRTPLALAAQHGNHEAVSFLCQQCSCKINMATYIGQTPLYLASVYNRFDTASFLIENGATVNQPDDYKVTPLAAACEHDNFEIVSLLLSRSAKINIADKEGLTALHKAAKQGNVKSCKMLFGNHVSLNEQDITGCTALHLAASCHNILILDMLLEAKSNINVENNLGNSPLHIAVSSHKEAAISKLIAAGASINHQNNYGETPIALSISSYKLRVMKFLFHKNADINCVDNMHRGLIHKAVENLAMLGKNKLTECKAVINSLIEYELDINAIDVNQQTPLHLAAKLGHLELVTFLVDNGANIAAKDSFKHLPLMSAIENPLVFQYLWSRSTDHMDEETFCKLHRLAHWFGLHHDLMKQISEKGNTQINLENMPQNVSRLKSEKYDNRLEMWLRSSNDELPDFMSDWLPSLQPLTYVDHPTINKVMWNFLKDLQDGVKKKNPFVAYAITQCGSVDEKTKVFAQDECDCSCVEENIRFDMFETPEKPDHPVWTAFVHLICKKEYVGQLKRILDTENKLSQGKLCHFFGKTIAQVIAEAPFWEKYPQIQRVSVKDISAGDRRICTMHVIWSDEICPQLELDIDLAPVIDLKNWKPSWCNQHPLINEIRCIALPKWKITHDVDMDLMEIGVHEWGPLFRKMPEEMRQGYRLAKVVRGNAVCPQIPQAPEFEGYKEWSNAGEFMNTYLLKQVVMHEYTAFYDQQQRGEDPQSHSDLYWARRIYEQMEEAFSRRELYSWFIPSYNLLNDDKFVTYQDVAVLYARLCRRLLTEEAADHFRKAYMGIKDRKRSHPMESNMNVQVVKKKR